LNRYVFDNCSLLIIFKHYYRDRFRQFWEKFDAAVADGQILLVRELYNEILDRARCTQLVEWIKENRQLFLQPSAEEMAFLQQIFAVRHFHSLVRKQEILEGRPVADPFVIAKAKFENAIVVTQEEYKPNAAKIPNVCEHFKIKWTDLEGFMKAEGWEF
jgi:hypothetical protein